MTKNKALYQRRATGYEPRELDDGEGNLPRDYEKRLTSRVTEVRSTIDDINDNIVVQTDGSNNPAAKLEGSQRKTYYFNGYRVEEERGGPTVSTEEWFLN